jgi:hypothetical protein
MSTDWLWSDCLSEIREGLETFLSIPVSVLIAALGGDDSAKGELETQGELDGHSEAAPHATSDTTPKELLRDIPELRRVVTAWIAALGGDGSAKGEFEIQGELDAQSEAAPHATSTGHAPWPDPNESLASFVGQGILRYHQSLAMLGVLLWIGHHDPLSVVVHDACDCCDEPIDLYQVIENNKTWLLKGLAQMDVNQEHINIFLKFHRCILQQAQGDPSRSLEAKIDIQWRRVYVLGRELFEVCTASFCPRCKEARDQRRSKAKAMLPRWLTIEPGDETGVESGLPVILARPSEEPTVLGKTKPRLNQSRYNVVLALLKAGDEGLSKDSLIEKSGHEDAVGILKRLAESDLDWNAVIKLAGIPGGRYRISH